MLVRVSGNANSTKPNDKSFKNELNETISLNLNGIILLVAPGNTSSWQNSRSCNVLMRRPNSAQNDAIIGITRSIS